MKTKITLIIKKYTVDNLNWVVDTTKKHSENLNVIQKDINDFISVFDENIEKIDKQVIDMMNWKLVMWDVAKKP